MVSKTNKRIIEAIIETIEVNRESGEVWYWHIADVLDRYATSERLDEFLEAFINTGYIEPNGYHESNAEYYLIAKDFTEASIAEINRELGE